MMVVAASKKRSFSGSGRLVRTDGRMNADKYREVLAPECTLLQTGITAQRPKAYNLDNAGRASVQVSEVAQPKPRPDLQRTSVDRVGDGGSPVLPFQSN